MQKQAENLKVSTKSFRKFIIIMLLALAAVSAWFSKDFISKYYKKFASKSPKEITQPLQNNEASRDELARKIKEQNDLKPVHKQEENDIVQGDTKPPLSQSLIEIDGANTPAAAGNNTLAHIDNYRTYLFNISSLISNFLQDKNYSSQIAYARIVNLPPSINEILELLEEYNINYLVTPVQEYENVFFENYKFVKKFFKVKKLTKSAKDKKQLQANIINNLELFQDYVYSKHLQKIFISQRE
jgi:hypothetical protein